MFLKVAQDARQVMEAYNNIIYYCAEDYLLQIMAPRHPHQKSIYPLIIALDLDEHHKVQLLAQCHCFLECGNSLVCKLYTAPQPEEGNGHTL